jgi:hypothetical protein
MTDPSAKNPGVFLLGVGAQKAGTSWLYQQLHCRPDADFGCLKEYHVHDARSIEELQRFRQLHWKPLQPRSWIQPRTWLRQWFIHHPGHYTEYFHWLLSRPRLRGAKIRLTGDITPSYALLSAGTLKDIKTNFQEHGIPVKPVFLMRDPIERLISSQRMKLRKQGVRDAATEVASLRKRVAKGRGLRSDYGQTLDALDQAFGLEQCFIGLFESLFTETNYAKLCRFLEISYREPAWSEKVNVSATANVIPDDLLADMGRQQAANLKRAQEALPNQNLQQLWPTTSRWAAQP